MNDSRRLGGRFGVDVCRRWPFLIVPIWVALTLIAAGAALASAVNAALFLLAALAGASALLVGWFVCFAAAGEADRTPPTAILPSTPGNRPAVVFLPARAARMKWRRRCSPRSATFP